MIEIGKYETNNLEVKDEIIDSNILFQTKNIGKYKYPNKNVNIRETNNKLILYFVVFIIIFVYMVNCLTRNFLYNKRKSYKILLKRKKFNRPTKKIKFKDKYEKKFYILLD
jgi:hypothetical protein